MSTSQFRNRPHFRTSFSWKQKRTVQVVNACAVLFFVVTNLEFVVSPQVKELSPIRSLHGLISGISTDHQHTPPEGNHYRSEWK